MTHVLIIGYGMAGARLANELRGRDREGVLKLTVLGAEHHPAYNRILLSSLLAGKISEADLTLAGSARHDEEVRLGSPAVSIDRVAQTVTAADGSIHPYDALVLATGSAAVVPPITGLEQVGTPDEPARIAVFRTLDDCRRILAVADGARSAIVLGGGVLGLEAARGLAGRGLRVDLVHPLGHLMDRQLDPAAGAVLARTIEALAVTTHLGSFATSVTTDGAGVVVQLADGRELRADQLVLSCGVRAESTLASAAGLAVDRGITVDDQLRTSDPAIYAIGDCAEFPGSVAGLVAPAWEQARVVADLISEVDPTARYRPVPPVTRLKAAGIDLAAVGESVEPIGADTDVVTFSDPGQGLYAKLVIRGDRLAGAIMLGDNPMVGTVIQHFDRQTPLPADRRGLLLGRSSAGAGPVVADSPALMPDSAVVCRCNNVTKGAITAAWLRGARDIGAATRASTGCGSCQDTVGGLVGWLRAQDGTAKDPEAEVFVA